MCIRKQFFHIKGIELKRQSIIRDLCVINQINSC
jgi:hypothetical protein